MDKVTPFLLFSGQADEAARFYVSLLPDSRIDRVTYFPSEPPDHSAEAVLTVEFTFGGMKFVALNGPKAEFTEAISFQITCADQAEVDRLWKALAEGGSEGRCGWLKDRYGVSWQVTPSRLFQLVTGTDVNRACRVMEAMMKMNKIDIGLIEAAAGDDERASGPTT